MNIGTWLAAGTKFEISAVMPSKNNGFELSGLVFTLCSLGILGPGVTRMQNSQEFFAYRGFGVVTGSMWLTIGAVTIWLCIWFSIKISIFFVERSRLMCLLIFVFWALAVLYFLVLLADALIPATFRGMRLQIALPSFTLVLFCIVLFLSLRFEKIWQFLGVSVLISFVALPFFSGNFSYWNESKSIISFEGKPRSNVLWIIADEATYGLIFDNDGNVRAGLSAISGLSEVATNYLDVYTSAPDTWLAVPAMFNGIINYDPKISVEVSEKFDTHELVGVIPLNNSEMQVHLNSIFFAPSNRFSHRLKILYLDAAAVTLKNQLKGFRRFFPETDKQLMNYFGSEPISDVESTNRFILEYGQSGDSTPFFALFHSLKTHAPWYDMSAQNKFQIGSTITAEVTRENYFQSGIILDHQIRRLIGSLKNVGLFDDTLIIFTADHGTTIDSKNKYGEGSKRTGTSVRNFIDEVGHVPLLVKYPNQKSSVSVSGLRSLGQIPATVASVLGANLSSLYSLGPSLEDELEEVVILRKGDEVLSVSLSPPDYSRSKDWWLGFPFGDRGFVK